MTIRDLFGIELPVVQAPMAGVQGAALAVAVSNAGGLGSLPCALLTIDSLRAELEALRVGTTRPFNVNFFCHTLPAQDSQRDAAWRSLLGSYLREFDIDPQSVPEGSSRLPFNTEVADLVEQYAPAVVSFHFGLPSHDLLARVRSWGSKIISSATTVAEAMWLEQHGVDAIIAQGWEAGGHRGMFLSDDLTTQVGTFALVPQIVRAVRVPVIAAGGIANAAGVRASMELGAAGVQLGTAYLLCPEATTGSVHRAALKSDAARETAVTNLITGRPARGIVNRVMRELGYVNPAAPPFPLASAAMYTLRAAAEREGSGDFSPLWCGQNSTGCREVPAAVITRDLCS